MTVTLLSDNRNSIIAKQSKYRQMNFWKIFYIDIIIIFHINIMHKDYNFYLMFNKHTQNVQQVSQQQVVQRNFLHQNLQIE